MVGLDVGSTNPLLEWFDLAKFRTRYRKSPSAGEISILEIHVQLKLDRPLCESRLVDTRRDRDRPEQPTGPLTAP